MANLRMISGDRSLAEGKHGAFYNTLEELHKYWDRIDIICPKPNSKFNLPAGEAGIQNLNFFELLEFLKTPFIVHKIETVYVDNFCTRLDGCELAALAIKNSKVCGENAHCVPRGILHTFASAIQNTSATAITAQV